MGKNARRVLIPIEQAVVPFYGGEILAVRLPDGLIAAILTSLCTLVGLASHGQLQRIRRDTVLSEQLLLVVIKTPRGARRADALIAEAIPRWAAGIQLSSIAPEKHPTILALKREADQVLYRHFFKEDTDASFPPPNPSADSPRSPRQMTHKAFERLHQVADALHQVADELDESYMVAQEQIEAMGDHIVALEAEVAALKQKPASKGASTPRQPLPQDGPILTAEHRNQVYALARHLRDQTGEPVAARLAELAATFGVEDMSDIPDAGWEQVKAWFWLRTQRN